MPSNQDKKTVEGYLSLLDILYTSVNQLQSVYVHPKQHELSIDGVGFAFIYTPEVVAVERALQKAAAEINEAIAIAEGDLYAELIAAYPGVDELMQKM